MAQILTKIKKVSTSLGHKNEYDNLEDNLLETSLLENDKIVLPVLKEIIRKYTDKSIWEALDYSLINKSHFDRAFFVRLGCEAVGGDFKSILPALASVELRYASGTAIDDVFDYNSERMGKPSMPKLYGNNLALCYGAILKSISSVSLLSLYNSNRVDLKSFIEINIKDEFTHYQVYLGQVSDILSEKLNIEEITDDFYLDMIKNATGVDAGYCFELGCLLGGGSIEQQKYFYEFGVSLGTAMQLRDDLLDYVNDKDLINKETGERFCLKLGYKKYFLNFINFVFIFSLTFFASSAQLLRPLRPEVRYSKVVHLRELNIFHLAVFADQPGLNCVIVVCRPCASHLAQLGVGGLNVSCFVYSARQ